VVEEAKDEANGVRAEEEATGLVRKVAAAEEETDRG